MSLVTRGLGPGVRFASFGYGPRGVTGLTQVGQLIDLRWDIDPAALLTDVVQGLVADFFGINAALQSPVQLSALQAYHVSLDTHLDILKILIDVGLVEDTTSIADALRASVQVQEAFKADDPEVGE